MIVTTKQTMALLDITRRNQNKNQRWAAIKRDQSLSELAISKQMFESKIDPILREYCKNYWNFIDKNPKEASQELQEAMASGIVSSEILDRKNMRQQQEKERIEKRKTEEAQRWLNEEYTSSGSETNLTIDDFMGCLKAVVGGMVALFFLIVLAKIMIDPPERESSEVSVGDAIASCVDSLKIDSACSADPVFTYCGIAYGSNQVLGSGCTTEVKRQGDLSAQVNFCKTKLQPIVKKQCAIDLYGCAAVTGSPDC